MFALHPFRELQRRELDALGFSLDVHILVLVRGIGVVAVTGRRTGADGACAWTGAWGWAGGGPAVETRRGRTGAWTRRTLNKLRIHGPNGVRESGIAHGQF